MNLFYKIYKLIEAALHSFISKYEDPTKMIEQGIRDLKKDFDESMKSVAQVKTISICSKREMEAKKQIAIDYENKATEILKKAQNGEIEQQEADRLATIALEKRQQAMLQVQKLAQDIKGYDESLLVMEEKILALKNKIKDSENEYLTLKARATVAKTSVKINKQLAGVTSDSSIAMIEDMKKKIQEEESLAKAYGEISQSKDMIDEEINKAIGMKLDTQEALSELKQKLLENPQESFEENEQETEVEENIESDDFSEVQEMKDFLDN